MAQRTLEFVDGQGLLGFWADVDEPYLLRFQQWHNCEHIPERVSIPGFLVGRRYRGLGAARMFFMVYETRDTYVLTSEAYLAALNQPSEWTRESLQHFRRPLRNAYRKLMERGQPPRLEAPYLVVYRFNSSAPGEDGIPQAAAAWVDATAVSTAVMRARLFEIDLAASSIETSERAIYRGEPGKQRYLVLIECSRPDPWNTVEQALAPSHRPDLALEDVDRESYWLEFWLSNSGS